MKKFLLPFLLAFSFLQVKAQTTTEISRILNSSGVNLSASNITALNGDAFSIDLLGAGTGYRGAGITLSGTWSATVQLQGSHDNSIWNTIMIYLPSGGTTQTQMFSNGSYNGAFTGFRYVRLRATAFTSGTVVVNAYGFFGPFDMSAISLSGSVSINSGGNIIGKVGIDQTTNGTTNRVNIGSDGTVAATQSGTWNLNNISGTISLPTGAATSAKQPALGTAGTPSSDVITVQGATSMTALKVDGSAVTQPVSENAATIPAATTLQNAATANGNGTTMNVQGYGTVILSVTSNPAMSGGTTVSFESSQDDATWNVISAQAVGGTNINTTTTSDGDFKINVAGNKSLRARISLYSAGTVTVKGYASPSATAFSVVQVRQIGTWSIAGTVSLPTNAAQETGGNLATVKTNTDNLSLAQGSTTSGQAGNLNLAAVTTAAPSYTTGQSSPLSLTTSGSLRVDGSGVTQPVSGTITANAGTNLNTSALALESGNLATVKTNTDNLALSQASTTSGQKGNLVLTATTTAAPTYTTAQSNPLSTTTAGALRVDASATTQPVNGTVTANAGTGTFNIQSNAAVNISQINGVTTLTGNGATGTGSQRVTIANDNNAVPTKLSQSTTDNDVDVATIAAGTNDIGYVNPDRTTSTTTITTAGNGNSFAVKGMESVGINITGTAATFVFKAQISMDGGTTWSDTWLDAVSGNKTATRNANGQYSIILAGGTSHVRVVLNSIVSGNFTYQYTATMVHDPSILYTGVPGSGQALPPLVAQVGGSDGTDGYALSINAKGTQGAKGLATQDLKDAGRTELRFYAIAAAAGTSGTETAITLTKSSGTSATSTGTSFVVTNGKRFRITHISIATRGHATATIQTTTFNLRINTGGAVTTTSTPIVFGARSATAAVASDWDRYIIPIVEGYEIVGDGTLQFGITANATYTTNAPTWDVTIIGYEY